MNLEKSGKVLVKRYFDSEGRGERIFMAVYSDKHKFNQYADCLIDVKEDHVHDRIMLPMFSALEHACAERGISEEDLDCLESLKQ